MEILFPFTFLVSLPIVITPGWRLKGTPTCQGTAMDSALHRTVAYFTLLVMGLGATIATGELTTASAQSPDIQARIKWEAANLALETEEYGEALVLLEEVMELTGPAPGVLYNAARCAFETKDYPKAQEYIAQVLETDDELFKITLQYSEAFKLAARIDRTDQQEREKQRQELERQRQAQRQEEKKQRQARVKTIPLPAIDSLSTPGFIIEPKKSDGCEWRYDRGGLIGKGDNDWTCVSNAYPIYLPVRIEVTMENREGDFGAGGIVFGWQSRSKRTTVTIQEVFKNSIYVASYFGNPTQEVIYDCSDRTRGHNWGGRYIPECEYISVKDRKGPWRLAVEISGKVFRVFVDGRLLQTYTRDEDIVGSFYLTVGGTGCSGCKSEWLFKDLRITELPSE